MRTLALSLLLPLALLACRKEQDPSTIDLDGDGVTAELDCDDTDPDRFQGNDELCNGLDDDCDEEIDEEAIDAPTWFADTDGDGYGDPDAAETTCEQPLGYVLTDTDCDDADAAFHPGAAEVDCTDPSDYNCDGSVGYADADGDGWAACEECDDSDGTVNPDADEVCNDIDDDCDGDVDQDAVDAPTWYADADGDGYGNPTTSLEDCDQPAGFVADATDCDDLWAAAFPGGTEVCDDHDNDCDGTVDESDAVDAPTWYEDADGDLWGDTLTGTTQCDPPDSTWVTRSGDCDDDHAKASPTGTEVCDDLDNDCDGAVDGSDAVDASTWYADTDADGHGDADVSTPACDQPSGYVADDSDCDDSDADTWPGADEYCDGADDDCDGTVDEDDAVDADTWYEDVDGDGYGGSRTTAACAQPTGYVSDGTDCDDLDDEAFPGNTEVCDGADNDCDGTTDEDDATDASTWYADSDGDSYGDAGTSTVACDEPSGYTDDDDDCDDTSASNYPGAWEVCDGEDNDCDGTTDEDDAIDATTWYLDADSDGYGDASSDTEACDQPSGYVADHSDCDDAEASANPGEDEVCDELDNDCDGEVDEDSAVDATTWYLDSDSDGYGDANAFDSACDAPAGFVADDSDCDDSSSAANPGATEVADGLDNDCDGLALDGSYAATSSTTLAGGAWEFDDFEVASGVTLTITGTTELEIYVLGDATVDGTIDLAGEDGDAMGDLYSASIAGGDGGGGGGGDGGYGGYYDPYGAHPRPAPDGYGVSPGDGGMGYSAGSGGGGGGQATDGEDGEASGGCYTAYAGGYGGSAVSSTSSPTLTPGSGGGGGGYGTGANWSGGGGGGGGGALFLQAANLDIAGGVYCYGGDGGSNVSGSARHGGGGGGGSGGTLWLVADTIDVSGTLDCDAGLGGLADYGTYCGIAGDGGDGAEGMIWLDGASSTSVTGTISPSYYVP